MKITLLTLFLSTLSIVSFAQMDTVVTKQDSSFYKIVKTDSKVFIGKILSRDAQEIIILTKNNVRISVPPHTVEEIIMLSEEDFSAKGNYVGIDPFATRYFITTNGLPIKKGEHYLQYGLSGPDAQFGLANNFGVGVMTTWIAMPVIATFKKSFQLGKKAHLAIGGLLGTTLWLENGLSVMLSFAAFSFGDRRKNITFSGGYGALWIGGGIESRALAGIAGMVKVAPKFTLVFDSFILLPTQQGPAIAFIMPGLRWHKNRKGSVQFGLAGILTGSGSSPLPMVQWLRRF